MINKNRNQINTILDLILFLVILAIFFVKGDLHETLAYTLGGLIILHIVLHWKQFKIMYRKLLPKSSQQIAAALVLALLAAGIFSLPMFVSGFEDGPRGYGDRPGLEGSGHYRD